MAYDGAVHRRQRGTGKCLLSRMINQMEGLLAASPSMIKTSTLDNCQENVVKAHRVFQEHHDAIVANDSSITDEQNEAELKLHDDGMLRYREAYQEVKDRSVAWVQAKKVRSSLDALEVHLAGRYRPDQAATYVRMETSMEKLRELFAPDDISEHLELRRLGEEVEEIWTRLILLRADAGFSTEEARPGESLPSSRRSVDERRSRSHLKVPPPTFSGQLSEFTDFKTLFMSIVDVEDLAEPSKKALMIKAMETPETKANAVSACKEVDTLEAAMKTFSLRYEDRKEVLAYHLGMILNMSLTKQNKADLEKMERVTRNSISGLKRVGGFTGEQMTIACMVNKMGPEVKKEWLRLMSQRKEPPELEMFYEFLRSQAQVVSGLKSMESVVQQDLAGLAQSTTVVLKEPYHGRPAHQKGRRWESKPGNSKTVFRATPDKKKCAFCEGGHVIHSCRDFKALSMSDRKAAVRNKRLCYNCLGEGHRVADCPSDRNCPTCGERHHSFLHESGDSESRIPVNRIISAADQGLSTTAVVELDAGKAEKVTRLMVDTGAEVCVVTECLSNTLQAERIPNSAVTLTGMGQVQSKYAVRLRLHGDPRVDRGDDVLEIRAQVVKEIPQPTGVRSVQELAHLQCVQGLPLADPTFAAGSRVDLLLSHAGWCEARMAGSVADEKRGVFLDKSMFGWVVTGSRVKKGRPASGRLKVYAVRNTGPTLEQLVEQQWKQEELPGEESPLSKEALAANAHFFDNHEVHNGFHTVGIPPHEDDDRELGESRSQAVRRYASVKRSLQRRGQWKEYYTAVLSFIQEGHAELVPEEDLKRPASKCYYMPMHAVEKRSSTSTKVRPVCDASATTTSGYSYNDLILVGPSLYQPIQSITNKFRDTSIGMTADVSKMYRRIGIKESDRDFHRFVFQIEGGELRDYRMTRLTFGVKSSPFLACKVLERIGIDNEENHPLAAEVIRDHFYMDDVLTGANTVDEASAKRADLNAVLEENALPLCKWRTNCKELLVTIPEELRETSALVIGANPSECQKTLGLHWSTETDNLYVSTPQVSAKPETTKREVASVTARIFDPLGWHSPSVMTPRILTQKAWQLHSGWDEPLPSQICRPFQEWVKEMPQLTKHPIPRAFGVQKGVVLRRELHGFADASEAGFGGVVYLRTVYRDGLVKVNQVSAKGRVAPLKSLTIPRLELQAALVVSVLLKATAADLGIVGDQVFGWSDSMVVLGWLAQAPSRLTTFVANRVARVQRLNDKMKWGHVPGLENPADCLSRGVNPGELVKKALWWDGPRWLQKEERYWPKRPNSPSGTLPEMKKEVGVVAVPDKELGVDQRCFHRWTRVLGWCLRFVHNSRPQGGRRSPLWLTAKEIGDARTTAWILSQKFHYSQERSKLLAGERLYKRNPLAKYAPFVDDKGVLRIGGRLKHAQLPESAIHSVVMSPKSVMTKLIVEETHVRMRHAPTSALIGTIAHTYHIPQLSRMIRSMRSKCMECQRAFSKPAKQMMGDLPAVRTSSSEVFSRVGIDYAGPVYTKSGRGRSYREIPTYLAVFVCMATRAIHIEVAADASTACFIAVLDRFVGRRGMPDQIWSDNGSNFVGAQRELREVTQELRTDQTKELIEDWSGRRHLEWHFQPARAPNFGGLWEAGVRGMKRLMGKVLDSARLNMDELNTIAVMCEAVLNSRPYLPLYSTVEEELLPLTPGHFLVGRPLSALPQRVQSISRLTRARRWQLVKELQHQLWERWRTEYLQTLQARCKQLEPDRNLKVGDVVLVSDDGVRRNHWPMARVSAVYPGPDGLVRVVDLVVSTGKKSASGETPRTWRRTVRKLIPLPLHVEEEDMEEEDTVVNPVPGEDVQAQKSDGL